ncbi:hypothetical protein AGLY_013999 [Aphis glycines]|uniref:Uncharacterized protein n=1 Tax=Aphis glycines TaxID=307491 RepID=A0A6G0T4U5_APHGL|nr:hypothetical protein AGLY_013999 [Aphis glycines]
MVAGIVSCCKYSADVNVEYYFAVLRKIQDCIHINISEPEVIKNSDYRYSLFQAVVFADLCIVVKDNDITEVRFKAALLHHTKSIKVVIRKQSSLQRWSRGDQHLITVIMLFVIQKLFFIFTFAGSPVMYPGSILFNKLIIILCTRSSWSDGLNIEAKCRIDTIASLPLFPMQPYPGPDTVLRAIFDQTKHK